MAAMKINLTKMLVHLLMLMWYRVISTKPFQHESLSYKRFVTQIFPDLWYMDVLHCSIPSDSLSVPPSREYIEIQLSLWRVQPCLDLAYLLW